jgi:hypothetical protein
MHACGIFRKFVFLIDEASDGYDCSLVDEVKKRISLEGMPTLLSRCGTLNIMVSLI